MTLETTMNSKKLLLVDGNAIVHRAFHALPGLTSPDGTLVNAVYGFFSMFLTVINDLKPEFVTVTFDRPKPTFRKSLYAGYQANRPQMADGMSDQFRILHEGLERMEIQIFEKDGFEADDVIGTIAHQVTDKRDDMHVVILTGDRDLLQLVTPQVSILAPIVGVKTTIWYDEAKVEEKYGVTPAQFVDYKALIGDASDGYPGVTGIGPKTASALLQKHGTFEALYENLGELSPKIAEKLAIDAEQAALAKKLAAIMKDVPLTYDVNRCGLLEVDTKAAFAVFDELGFASLTKRFGPQLKELETRKQAAKNGEQLGLL